MKSLLKYCLEFIRCPINGNCGSCVLSLQIVHCVLSGVCCRKCIILFVFVFKAKASKEILMPTLSKQFLLKNETKGGISCSHSTQKAEAGEL